MAVPELHRAFLDAALPVFRAEKGLLGVAVGGSWIRGEMDAFSDLDLLLVHPEDAAPDRFAVAAAAGPLLRAFTGEHVGMPHSLICLYGPPLLHVDLAFVPPGGLRKQDGRYEVLFDRDGTLERTMAGFEPPPRPLDKGWIDDRFWTWIHYTAAKVGRGELFEALDALAFLRARVLAPLFAAQAGAPLHGVRRFEQRFPARVPELRETVAGHEARDILRAVRVVVRLYETLRPQEAHPIRRAVLDYLDEIESGLS